MYKLMKNSFLFTLVFSFLIAFVSCNVGHKGDKIITMSKKELQNKVKGGWAGQVIGVTYGGPTEFRYLQKLIPDTVELRWDNELVEYFYDSFPGLYDDIYMDLTFVDVFEKEGLDAPISSHANAFANADYMLWHANQAARYNILNGIMPPESGHWKYNMHADDIDFQIEADFAGLMSPGMINSAAEICDKIGHIMNYGDGYYGGVYVASMYALAFISDDINYIVNEALKIIPKESNYCKCMQDVINLHKTYPNDWKKAWQAIEDSEWSIDLHCPDGISSPFNIDATVNSAYVLLGLLYGQGDLLVTMDVSTRAGQDSDCNPATAAGILCTMLGYDKISDYWLDPLKSVADRKFRYTTISLNDVYDLGYKHALEMVKRNEGKINDETVEIKIQIPKTIPLEVAFPNIYPTKITHLTPTKKLFLGNYKTLNTLEDSESIDINFKGVGLVVEGAVSGEELNKEYVAKLEVSIDRKVDRIVKLPVDSRKRSAELYWNVSIPNGDHTASLKWLNPIKGGVIGIREYTEFGNIKGKIQVMNR